MYGEGKAFCAGGDLKFQYADNKNFHLWRNLYRSYHLNILFVSKLNKPI